MTLAVVRSIGTPRRLTTAQEYEDFEQELVDQFLLAGISAGMADSSIADDRRAIFEYARFLSRPVWTYLDYRCRRWPRTANPHLFVS